jgi:hypothetical protein
MERAGARGDDWRNLPDSRRLTRALFFGNLGTHQVIIYLVLLLFSL